MRIRVATIVTLLTMVLLGILLAQSCSMLTDEENRDIRDALYLTCQASAATLEDESSEGRLAALEDLETRDAEIVVGAYNANGASVIRRMRASFRSRRRISRA